MSLHNHRRCYDDRPKEWHVRVILSPCWWLWTQHLMITSREFPQIWQKRPVGPRDELIWLWWSNVFVMSQNRFLTTALKMQVLKRFPINVLVTPLTSPPNQRKRTSKISQCSDWTCLRQTEVPGHSLSSTQKRLSHVRHLVLKYVLLVWFGIWLNVNFLHWANPP